MKFIVPNYSCLQNPWLRGYHPQIPVLSVLNWICWTPPPQKIPGYASGSRQYTIPLTFTSHVKLHYHLFLQHYVKSAELCLFHKTPQLTPILILMNPVYISQPIAAYRYPICLHVLRGVFRLYNQKIRLSHFVIRQSFYHSTLHRLDYWQRH